MNYTTAKIKKYYLQFHSLVKYEDKVKFFDENFSIVPFQFPAFKVDLYAFFSDEHFYRLHEILHYERTENTLIRNFPIGNELYSFGIRPFHNNAIILNKYILSKFLGTREQLNQQVTEMIATQEAAGVTPALQLEKANDALMVLQARFRQEYKLNFKSQFITVFVKGMIDAGEEEQPQLFSRKKKMIELYLYAMGFLFGRYQRELKRILNEGAQSYAAAKMPEGVEKKVVLLQELGFIEAVNRKYSFLNKTERNKKIAEVLSLVTGDNWFKGSGVIEFLTSGT
ncbi:MAG TPA: hypothetical protein VGC22_10875 [Chitinophaga sp.]